MEDDVDESRTFYRTGYAHSRRELYYLCLLLILLDGLLFYLIWLKCQKFSGYRFGLDEGLGAGTSGNATSTSNRIGSVLHSKRARRQRANVR